MLSAEEKERFSAAIEDRDPSQGRARSLFEKLMQESLTSNTLTKHWWEANDTASIIVDASFVSAATNLANQKAIAKAATLEYNVLALLLAYSYIVRHLDVVCLQDLQVNAESGESETDDFDDMPPLESVATEIVGDDDHPGTFDRLKGGVNGSEGERAELRHIAKEHIKQMCPFLEVRGEASKTTLKSVEEVSLWNVSRMDKGLVPFVSKMTDLWC
jgi:hypothetical protein